MEHRVSLGRRGQVDAIRLGLSNSGDNSEGSSICVAKFLFWALLVNVKSQSLGGDEDLVADFESHVTSFAVSEFDLALLCFNEAITDEGVTSHDVRTKRRGSWDS